MKKFLTTDTLLICIAAILATYTLTYPFVRIVYLTDTGPSWWGLDISWEMTMNYAAEHKWVWGKDIIYTYGPLGFLATRLGYGIWKWTYLAFDIFLAFNFFIAFLDLLRGAKDKWVAFFMILLVLLTISTFLGADLSWALLFFSFVWMYRTYHDPRIIYFILLCINVLICFYVKLNTGLVGTILLAGHLGNLVIFKKIKWPYACIVLGGLIASIIAASFALHVYLPGYIKGAMEVINGYNDIMHLDIVFFAKLESQVTILYYAFLIFIAIYIIALIKNKRYSELFFAGLALAYIFLLRKQSSIRNDEAHYTEFFLYAPLLLLSPFFLRPFEKMQRPLACCMLLLATVPLLYKIELGKRPVNDVMADRFAHHTEYFTAFEDYGKVPFLNNRHKRYIPERVLNQIQNQTVDIFPWDSEYLIEHNLNYKPRPMFQSFSAYTRYLQEMNNAFYEKNAPEYIIYDFETIDERYPFNDDLLANFFISKNYAFADSFTSNERWRALFRKKEKTSPLIIEKVKSAEYRLEQEIPVDNAMMIRAFIDFTPKGKFESVYYSTPRVAIQMMHENGEWSEYKMSKLLLEAGAFVDRDVKDNHDFVKYVNDRSSLGKIPKIKIFANDTFYRNKIRVEYYNIK